MRVAFTSCFSAELFPNQPVWTQIARARPDFLVLLGDSIYLDCSGGLAADGTTPLNAAGLQTLSADEFAGHAHRLYQRQLQQPEFQALLDGLGRDKVFAIWDDHDFLWDNACGADVMGQAQTSDLVFPTRALFRAWCDALAGSKAFPGSPPPYANAQEPGYRHVDLGEGVHLHLTDGRSFRRRDGSALLGMAQLQAMEAEMVAAGAGSTHLVASGSVVEQRGGECWAKCRQEYGYLLQTLAQAHDILVLSGDIHDNNLAAYQAGARRLYEATASGAALRTLVDFGALQRNYGILDIDAGNVHVEIFKSGTVPQYRGTIDRQHWT